MENIMPKLFNAGTRFMFQHTLLRRTSPLFETFFRGTTNFAQAQTAGLFEDPVSPPKPFKPYAHRSYGMRTSAQPICAVFKHVTENYGGYISLSKDPKDAFEYALSSQWAAATEHKSASANVTLIDARAIKEYHPDYMEVQAEIKAEDAKPIAEKTLTEEQMRLLKLKALDHEVMIRDTLNIYILGVIIFDKEGNKSTFIINRDHIPFDVIKSSPAVEARIKEIAKREDDILTTIRDFADRNGITEPLSEKLFHRAKQAVPELGEMEMLLYISKAELYEMPEVMQAKQDLMDLTKGTGEVDISTAAHLGLLQQKSTFDEISYNKPTAELLRGLQKLEAEAKARLLQEQRQSQAHAVASPRGIISTGLYLPASLEAVPFPKSSETSQLLRPC